MYANVEHVGSDRTDNVRVLIVDDDAGCGEAMSLLLQMEGYETLVAQSAMDGLSADASFQPHCAILDLRLNSTFSGAELARRLRQIHGDEGILLIAASGAAREDVASLVETAGFDHHFMKPLNTRRLLDVLPPTGGA